MHVVGHHYPVVQNVLALMKMPQSVRHKLRNLRPSQMALADATVQVPFDLPPELALYFFAGLRPSFGAQFP
jgi:hypothetical protein